ncbi:uncharacterized protein LOC128032039 [Gossypium raimondii]|uniref:uncharacterized protein LOC128032039 n=1 Tax=Gossypium raimondii TaxID=29730 RepID=UPI00227B395C|nr:uncharacterized protein LOC128032039 [Gossypium raimondii]
MSFDGASNALGHRIGAVLVSPEGDHYPLTARLNFFCTNNIAEYEACIMGLRAAIERKIEILEVHGDLALVIYQIRGDWEVRDLKLVKYHDLVTKLVKEFKEVTFNYFPREENQLADALATFASMFKANRETEIIIEEESDGRPWFHDILEYIKNQRYPEQANENDKRTIRRMAIGFVLDGDILYKRGKDQVLLRCVGAVEARKILDEVHEGICGMHASGFTMARQIMRLGYYWLMMERDCIGYARKCHKCQIYGDKINAAPSPLHVMTSPWHFSMWGMDVIRPISPKASNGHRFIFVIKHHNSLPYRPKMKGAVEAANKNIKRIIGKMTETYKDWHEKLPFALYAYRTSVRTSTGATPFFSSLRNGSYSAHRNGDPIPTCLDGIKMYQKRMITAHDKRVRPREFLEGELVLRKILPIQKDFRGKWSPNWKGPYVVKKAFSGGALILTEMDGKELPNPVNSDAVKKYYA